MQAKVINECPERSIVLDVVLIESPAYQRRNHDPVSGLPFISIGDSVE